MRRSVTIMVAFVTLTMLAGSAASASNATAHGDQGDCSGTGWHTYYAPDNDRFMFGTFEYDGDCLTLKVQARYWTDAPPYGWVTTSTYSGASSVVLTLYDAPSHDWSKHSICDPTCLVFDLF